MSINRYLTKSRFALALDCETKLYYTGKPKEYADQRVDDPFLEALAEGGFQVGELDNQGNVAILNCVFSDVNIQLK